MKIATNLVQLIGVCVLTKYQQVVSEHAEHNRSEQ